jgi:hypothetical protein
MEANTTEKRLRKKKNRKGQKKGRKFQLKLILYFA